MRSIPLSVAVASIFIVSMSAIADPASTNLASAAPPSTSPASAGPPPVAPAPTSQASINPASDPMTGYYDNTVISTGGMAEVHIQYNVDHTFVMNVPAFSLRFKGTWAVNASTICFTYDVTPPGVTNPDCGPFEAHKVGDTWTQKADDGQRSLSLVAGMQ
jgi:hypothetical protein